MESDVNGRKNNLRNEIKIITAAHAANDTNTYWRRMALSMGSLIVSNLLTDATLVCSRAHQNFVLCLGVRVSNRGEN